MKLSSYLYVHRGHCLHRHNKKNTIFLNSVSPTLHTFHTQNPISFPHPTLYENPGDEARLPLVVDEAEVLARGDGEHGRHVEAEVGRGEVHPVGRPQDHSAVVIVRDELGRGALLGPSAAASKAALGAMKSI